MKRIFSLILVALLLMLVSCDLKVDGGFADDDDAPPQTQTVSESSSKEDESSEPIDGSSEAESNDEITDEISDGAFDEAFEDSSDDVSEDYSEDSSDETSEEASKPETSQPETSTPDESGSGDVGDNTPPVNVVVTQEVLDKIEAGFFRLINQERTSNGLTALTKDLELERAAQIRAVETVQSFSHTRPNGESCFTAIDKSGYNWSLVGENIGYTSHVSGESFYPSEAVFTGSDEQIEKVYTKMFNAFKNSPGHYENIMTVEFIHTGIGVTFAPSDYEGIPYFYFAHFFGNK